MKKINFENLPSTNTPINATNLNLMQSNIEEVFNGKSSIDTILVGDVVCKNVWNNDSTLIANRNNDVSLKEPLEAGTYTLSWSKMTTNSTNTPLLAFSGSTTTKIYLPLDKNSITFTLSETVNKYRFYPNSTYDNSNGISTTLENVQLEKGSEASEYTTHKEYGYEYKDITDKLVYPNEYSSTNVKLYKFGNLIHLEGTISTGSNITSGQIILSLPAEYAPKVGNNFAVVGGGNSVLAGTLSNKGNFVVYGTTSWLGFSINWII